MTKTIKTKFKEAFISYNGARIVKKQPELLLIIKKYVR